MPMLFWLTLFISNAFAFNAQERITKFTSEIVVNADATLRVQETIEVVSTGAQIIHGIVREFPTSYRHRGVNYVVDFSVQSVLCDGENASFWIEDAENGKRLYIGERGRRITKGKHTYTITYTTNRQLGFFQNHDELYWNVTGNGWRLPIDKVYAVIQLPSNVPSASITAEGYTGFQSEQGKNYTSEIKGDRVVFSTTHPLQSKQGFTIAVTWPKGFVSAPSWYQEWYWFIKDNLFILWTFCILLLLLVLMLYTYMVARRKNKPGVVIPLFYPPAGFTPSMVGFMKARQFKNEFFAADIVNLAVCGFIAISLTSKGLFKKNRYKLKLLKEPKGNESEPLNKYEIGLLSLLFGIDKYKSKSKEAAIVIDQENITIIDAALKKTSERCERKTSDYITTLSSFLYLGYALCVVWVMGALFLGLSHHEARFFVYVLAAFIGLTTVIMRLYCVYTPQGRALQDQIDGFELYLTTAETERMNLIGTPPTRTPELYEKYLPYAIALGVEKQWTEQFASVFATLAVQGHTYQPRWYVGGGRFNGYSFASDIGSSFHSAIASASTPPGKSSGSGGRGSSGGGGGGGGGGGW